MLELETPAAEVVAAAKGLNEDCVKSVPLLGVTTPETPVVPAPVTLDADPKSSVVVTVAR